MTCPVDYSMPPNTKPVVLGALEEQNIEFLPHKELEKVEGNKLYFKDGSDPLEFTVMWSVWPIRAPDFVQESGLAINPKGTVNVEDKVINTVPGAPNAHVIGDACRVPFGKAGIPKAGEFAWKMGVSVADAIAGQRKAADRSGMCTAEAGFDKGFIITPDFSDVCNDPENGKPKVGIEKTDKGTEGKVTWANGYLKEIFGDNVKPIELK
jgi:NADH dehydrogenase FAD-containing subunit